MAEEILPVFQEENIYTEEIGGLHIETDGAWIEGEVPNTEAVVQDFMKLEMSVRLLNRMMSCKPKVTEENGDIIAEADDTQSFDSEGKIPVKPYICPNCGKSVEKLLKNGYCSKTCAAKARAEKAREKVNAAGEKTLEIISEIQSKLQLLDLALNVIAMFPKTIKDSVKLPQEYRDYIILRIETMFLKMKKIINNIEISRNEKMIELMKKIKFGSIDEKLSVIMAPIQAVIATIIALQQALNTAIAGLMTMLKNKSLGALDPNGGHGFLMTAKSAQYPETSGKILVEIKPEINNLVNVSGMMNTIDVDKIQKIIDKVLPPIQDVEYFLEPTAFKVRYAFSKDNAPKVKMMIDLLEYIIVQCPGECFPRYQNLKLTRVFYVLAILTGWGPVSRKIFGDFVFHGTV